VNNLKNIEIIKEALLLHLEDTPVVRAILFGSYAKNTANSMSDIDLVIDSRGRLKGLKFFGLLDKLTNSLGKNIDLIEMCEIEENSSIFNVITEEGVIVYDRTH
jgi:uncharacterized protein